MKNHAKEKARLGILFFALGTFAMPWVVTFIDIVMSGSASSITLSDFSYFEAIHKILYKEPCGMLFLLSEGCLLMTVIICVIKMDTEIRSDMYQVTDRISIPIPSGEFQQGSAWFLSKKDYGKAFGAHEIDPSSRIIRLLLKEGKKDFEEIEKGVIPDFEKIKKIDAIQEIFDEAGLVIGRTLKGKKEVIYSIDHDSHFLSLGATRSGKTRCIVLQSIGLLALSGESMLITDVKGELADYTRPYLERLGYEVYVLDYKEPEKSNKYNVLQFVIEAARAGDFDTAEERAADFAKMLVPDNDKSEPIWPNGERAVIEMAILSVVLENMDHPEYQNLYNVYRFIAEMNNQVVINKNRISILDLFMEDLKRKNPNHKAVLAYATIQAGAGSPKTVSSFLVSAMTTLKIFSTGKMNAMSNTSDFSMSELGDKKTAVFIILPDQKDTYYKIATAVVANAYDGLIRKADQQGGRLERRVRFLLDEFGNFAKLSAFSNMETAGGSRGVLFGLFLQDFAQIDEKYSRETSRIVRSNCETWAYLRSDDPETLKTISDKLGNYTCTVYNASSNAGNRSFSRSNSSNKVTRNLLTTSELQEINRPYLLITSREKPAVMESPDLSEWYFNTMFGMGDKEHNIKLRKYRNQARRVMDISGELNSWGIWNSYRNIQLLKSISYLEMSEQDFDPIKYRVDEIYRTELNKAYFPVSDITPDVD
ncbi:VirD4-like conjugal transfer protein, CD1115 family [Eubacterium sp. 1001713B170207_170306_E7]|uniref:VirD4-like conjugal transfer protein, CD1115 family n=1 Tax=Eubacterium sp. 1001713B170207_170306_E7 TaxID=2787097 RepID=UPI001899D247|nr:type IV secretory system conjugative DNA transfer family protein [Eubacterium sp. 1001713B170207_170306_E7]